MTHPDWIIKAFKTVDLMESRAFAALIADDGRFRFGSMPAVTGRPQVEIAVGGFFSSIRSLSHRIEECFEGKDSWLVQGEVTYTRHDGSQITLPFLDLFRMKGREVQDWLIYMDIAPLYASRALA